MVNSDFFDAFLAGGYLPNMHDVTLTSPDGTTAAAVALEARREPTDEQIYQSVAALYGAEVVTYFFPVAQTNFVRPRHEWKIVDVTDETTWKVVRDDLTISDRGVPVVCVPYRV